VREGARNIIGSLEETASSPGVRAGRRITTAYLAAGCFFPALWATRAHSDGYFPSVRGKRGMARGKNEGGQSVFKSSTTAWEPTRERSSCCRYGFTNNPARRRVATPSMPPDGRSEPSGPLLLFLLLRSAASRKIDTVCLGLIDHWWFDARAIGWGGTFQFRRFADTAGGVLGHRWDDPRKSGHIDLHSPGWVKCGPLRRQAGHAGPHETARARARGER